MPEATFNLTQDKAKEWRWNLVAPNNKIVATSGEGYKNETDCRDGIEAVKKYAAAAKIVKK